MDVISLRLEPPTDKPLQPLDSNHVSLISYSILSVYKSVIRSTLQGKGENGWLCWWLSGFHKFSLWNDWLWSVQLTEDLVFLASGALAAQAKTHTGPSKLTSQSGGWKPRLKMLFLKSPDTTTFQLLMLLHHRNNSANQFLYPTWPRSMPAYGEAKWWQIQRKC